MNVHRHRLSLLLVGLGVAVAGCGAGSSSDLAGGASTTARTSSSYAATSSPRAHHHDATSRATPTTTGPSSARATAIGSSADAHSSTAGPTTGPTTGPSHDPTDGPSASATPGSGIEVLPETPGATPGGLPGLPSTHPHALPALVTRPLPAAASAQGRLTHGYPVRVLPLPPRSSVVASSLAPSGSHLQVSLTARTTLRVARLERFYRSRLQHLGLQEVSSPATPGARSLGFVRGRNQVTLTIERGRVVHYSLSATLVAGR